MSNIMSMQVLITSLTDIHVWPLPPLFSVVRK